MKFSGLLVAATVGTLAFTAMGTQAATEFDLSLTVNEVAQTWQAYGQLSGNLAATSGLSAIEFSVVGSNGVTVTNSVNDLPVGSGNATFSFSGFGFGSSNGTAGVNIQGIQLSPKYYKDSATGNTNILTGVGLTAGTQSNATWGYPVLLASGTYSGTTGTLTISNTSQQVLLLPYIMPTPDSTGNVGIQTMYTDAVGGQAHPIYLLGDTNGDGSVNIVDLGTLATNYNGTGASWAQGDFNGDGVVNIVDLGILATHYNESVGAGMVATGASPASGVPEPASLCLLGAGALMLLRRRRCY